MPNYWWVQPTSISSGGMWHQNQLRKSLLKRIHLFLLDINQCNFNVSKLHSPIHIDGCWTHVKFGIHNSGSKLLDSIVESNLEWVFNVANLGLGLLLNQKYVVYNQGFYSYYFVVLCMCPSILLIILLATSWHWEFRL